MVLQWFYETQNYVRTYGVGPHVEQSGFPLALALAAFVGRIQKIGG